MREREEREADTKGEREEMTEMDVGVAILQLFSFCMTASPQKRPKRRWYGTMQRADVLDIMRSSRLFWAVGRIRRGRWLLA